MSERHTLELVLSFPESHEGDDAVLAIYEFDRPTHFGDDAFMYFSICQGPGPGGMSHSDEPLAA